MTTTFTPALPPPVPAAMLIDRLGLASAVTVRLRDMIIEGTLTPGTRLNERVLCEQLAVSRTPLREAFKVLAGEGLIELLPNRGAAVAELSLADIEQTFEVLGALEGFSGQLACERITDAEVAEIRALHYEMLAAHARHDLAAYYKINHVIHDLINAGARNAVLTGAYLQMNARIQNLRFRSNFNQDKWNAAVKEHSAMLDALERRDGDALRAVLEHHLLSKRDTVVSGLKAARASAEAAPAGAAPASTAVTPSAYTTVRSVPEGKLHDPGHDPVRPVLPILSMLQAAKGKIT